MHRLPFVSEEESFFTAPKLDGAPRFGSYGTIEYGLRGPFSYKEDIRYMYHPVNSEEEALKWLEYYRERMSVNPGFTQHTYVNVKFIPYATH